MSPAVFAGVAAPANLAGTGVPAVAGTGVPAVAGMEFPAVAEDLSLADDAGGAALSHPC